MRYLDGYSACRVSDKGWGDQMSPYSHASIHYALNRHQQRNPFVAANEETTTILDKEQLSCCFSGEKR